jgi:hypothetical protein
VSMKRIVLVALALLALSATAALAASWETGDYKGETDGKFFVPGKKGKPGHLRTARISFTVKQHKVGSIVFEVRVKCSDGSHTSWRVAHGGSLPLDSDGSFGGGAATDAGTGRDTISGKVSGTKASGTVRRHDKENSKGNEKSNGMKCDSGKVHWTAHKKQ